MFAAYICLLAESKYSYSITLCKIYIYIHFYIKHVYIIMALCIHYSFHIYHISVVPKLQVTYSIYLHLYMKLDLMHFLKMESTSCKWNKFVFDFHSWARSFSQDTNFSVLYLGVGKTIPKLKCCCCGILFAT